jgi:hypothetical protein
VLGGCGHDDLAYMRASWGHGRLLEWLFSHPVQVMASPGGPAPPLRGGGVS